uniref:Uncharacterized protein n=1 Tax=Anguilla anguilla TaxID=7936 RepID=A0A0E9X6F8_ANGAN
MECRCLEYYYYLVFFNFFTSTQDIHKILQMLDLCILTSAQTEQCSSPGLVLVVPFSQTAWENTGVHSIMRKTIRKVCKHP